MSQTVTVSNSVYEWLQAEAEQRGLSSVEELLEAWKIEDDELQKRREVGERILALRERIAATHPNQTDSVDLIREDRDR
jgi:predicted CopG family antitoxin